MTGSLHLTGFCDSVNTRAVRLALAEAGAAYDYTEVDPFTPGCAAALTGLQPFGRVPVLRHGAFVLHETAAILGYVSDACAGQALMPRTPQARARVWQATGIIDSYGYLPLVRQVFSHGGVYRVLTGAPVSAGMVAQGLAAVRPVLDALEAIVNEGLILDARTVSVADCHLAAMIDCFDMVPEGREMMMEYPALGGWLDVIRQRDSFVATTPPWAEQIGQGAR